MIENTKKYVCANNVQKICVIPTHTPTSNTTKSLAELRKGNLVHITYQIENSSRKKQTIYDQKNKKIISIYLSIANIKKNIYMLAKKKRNLTTTEFVYELGTNIGDILYKVRNWFKE